MQRVNYWVWPTQTIRDVCFVLTLFWLTPVTAEDNVAGTIGIWNGPTPPCFELIRNNVLQQLPVVISNKLLYEKDVIRLRQPEKGCSIPLVLATSITVTLSERKTSYTVGEEQEVILPPATVGGNFRNMFSKLMGKIAGVAESLNINAHPYGDTAPPKRGLGIPMLQQGSKIAAGTHELHLGWRGGYAPYQLTVSCGNEEVKVKAIDSEKQEATLEAHMFTEGQECKVEIKDNKDNKESPVNGKFVVSKTEEQCVLESEKETKAIQELGTTARGKTLLAVCLAKQPVLLLQAYQKVAGITEYYPAATLVKEGLKMGFSAK